MSLTEQQKLEFNALLAEAEKRGLKLPDEVNPIKKIEFPLGLNGYFTKRNGKIFNPSEVQEQFVKSRARFSLFVGGRGSGKTASGSQKALFKIKQGEPGAILNPDFENLRTSTWPEFKKWIPWNMVAPADRYRSAPEWSPVRPFTLNFHNGAFVIVKGIRDPDSARGPNINWLWYDEGGRDYTGESWQIANPSVRVGHEPQAWVTATPAGKDHWMYDLFWKQNIPEDALEAFTEDRELIEMFVGSIEDNKENLDPGFYASIIATYPPGWLREQEVHGRFVDQGGVLGDRTWFAGQFLNEPPDLNIKARVRYWDLAASERKVIRGKKLNDPDESVGTRLSYSVKNGDNQFVIEHQIGGFWEYKDLRQAIFDTAVYDGPTVPIYLEEEPGSGGKNQVAAIEEWLHKRCDQEGITRFQVKSYRPDNDRVILANIWFGEAARGQFWMVRGQWNDKCLDQLASFPIGAHDDRITSISGARINVAPIKQWSAPRFIHLGMKFDG